MILSEALFVSKLTYLIDSGLLFIDFDIVTFNDSKVVSTLMLLGDLKNMYCKPT